MSPWFQAKLDGPRAGMKAQSEGSVHVGPPVAKKNQSGSAKSVNVGVLAGSAVIMCSVFSSTGSASACVIPFSTWPEYGFNQLSPALSRSSARTFGSVRSGLPSTWSVGASRECTDDDG